MKKLLLISLCMILLIGSVSAFDFDNVKSYDINSKEVTITNAFGLGGEVAKLKLETPEVNLVGIGYQRVAEIKFNSGDGLKNYLDEGNFELYDTKKGNKKFTRQLDFKIKVTKQILIDDYTCRNKVDGSDCHISGNHLVNRTSWVNLEDYNFNSKGEISVGIFTNVKVNETVEWIPTIYGVRINEWAVWTSNLNNGLVAWYPLNETSGSTVTEVVTGDNGVYAGALPNPRAGVSSITNNSQLFNGTTGNYGNLSSVDFVNQSHDFSFSAWINVSSFATNRQRIMALKSVNNFNFATQTAFNTLYISGNGDSDSDIMNLSTNLVTNKWYHVVVTYDNSTEETIGYLNGTQVFNGTLTWGTDTRGNRIGQEANSGANPYNGSTDEIGFWNRTLTGTEALQLFNSGDGCTYNLCNTELTITLLAPQNNTGFTSSNVDLSANVSDALSLGISNVTAEVWNIDTNTLTFSSTNSSTLQGTYNFSNNFDDGNYNWTVYVRDDSNTLWTTDTWFFSLDANSPSFTVNYPTSLIDYATLGNNLTLNWSVTETNMDSCWYDYSGTNITLGSCSSGVNNLANITLTNKKNVTFYANDTAGNFNQTVWAWDYKVFENNRSLNSSTYETARETYSINVTANSSLTDVGLIYNNTLYSTTQSGTIWSKSFDIPLTEVGTNNIYWNFTYGGEGIQSTNSTQEVSGIDFNLSSSAPLDNAYINFSFLDEADLSVINASIPTSSFVYYLGQGTVNKTLTYINNVENFSFAFAFNPPNRTLKVIPTVQYTSTGYQQRIYTSSVLELTNVTTNQTLYLLGDLDGVFATYRVLSGSGQLLSGTIVNATRVIGSDTVLVGSGTTDDTGQVTMWLNPNFVHSITFFKEGFPISVRSITPQGEREDIVLEGSDTPAEPIIDYTQGITQSVTPIDQYLNNGTLYNFTYSISTTFWALDQFGFNLTYLNGTLIGSESSTNSGGGTLTLEANTLDSSRVIMNYYYIANGTTINSNKYWLVNTVTGYGLTAVFDNLGTYINSDIYGFLGQDGTGNFSKALLSILILITVAGVLSYKYGIASEPMVMGVLFGLVLFLNSVNLLPDPTLPMKVPFGDFLAFVIALMTILFIVREELR